MKIKIQGGTAAHGDPPLCLSCRYAAIAAGVRTADRVVKCSRLDTRITFPVTSCTDYLHRRHPSLWHMEDIAWVLRTDTKRNTIGFVRAKDRPRREQILLDDD